MLKLIKDDGVTYHVADYKWNAGPNNVVLPGVPEKVGFFECICFDIGVETVREQLMGTQDPPHHMIDVEILENNMVFLFKRFRFEKFIGIEGACYFKGVYLG